MSTIKNFHDARAKLAELNKEAVKLAAKIQENIEELRA